MKDKLDLADHGITLAELIEHGGKRIDAAFKKDYICTTARDERTIT